MKKKTFQSAIGKSEKSAWKNHYSCSLPLHGLAMLFLVMIYKWPAFGACKYTREYRLRYIIYEQTCVLILSIRRAFFLVPLRRARHMWSSAMFCKHNFEYLLESIPHCIRFQLNQSPAAPAPRLRLWLCGRLLDRLTVIVLNITSNMCAGRARSPEREKKRDSIQM